MDWLKIREKIYERIGKINTIDTLMKNKVAPYVILDELPLPIQIGEKVIYVGNLNLKNEDFFFTGFAKILGNLGLQHLFMELLSDGMKLMEYLKINRKLMKDLSNLIGRVLLNQQIWYYVKKDKAYKLNKCSLSYFKNNLTKEKLIQMVFLIYLYNYDSLGKSLALIINKMDARAISQTYMYTWLENLAGVSGSFLSDQLPNLDWYNKEAQFSKK